MQRQLQSNRSLSRTYTAQMYELQYEATQLSRRIAYMEGTDLGPDEKHLQETARLMTAKETITKEMGVMQARLLRQSVQINNLQKALDHQEVVRGKNETVLAETMLYLHTTQRALDKVKARKIVSCSL